MRAEELLQKMTEQEIKALQMSNGDAARKARRIGIDLSPFSETSDACQLALIAYADARVYQKKLVTRGEEGAGWKDTAHLDDRTERMMTVVNSHVLDNEPVVVCEPFDYSW